MKTRNLSRWALIWSAFIILALGWTTTHAANPVMTSAGSTYNRGDFTATNAFFWSSIDISQFAGIDTGSTHNYIEVLDATGKLAIGYLAGVGADVAETLGSELITSWDGGNFDTFISVGGNVTSAIVLAPVKDQYTNNPGLHSMELIKGVFNLTMNSGSVAAFFSSDYSQNWGLVNGAQTIYKNTNATSGLYHFYGYAAMNFSCDLSLKRVTDPPATAVHIVSSLNGTTRAWASIESGFNPNTITSWIIYSSIPMTRIGGSKGPVNFGFGMTNSGVINSGMIR
jgi:hypothetical protein